MAEKAGCNCAAIEAEMNRQGVAGCLARRDYFLEQLAANAASYSWVEKVKAGLVAWQSGAPLSLAGLFDEAVRLASLPRPVVVNVDRIGWGDLAIFAYIATGTRNSQTPLVIGATGEKARHVRLLGLEPGDPASDPNQWTAFTAEMEHLHGGGTTGRLEFYADHYGVPRLFEKPQLSIPDEDRQFARSLGIDRNTVLLFPDSLSPNRVWPHKHYWNELADHLAAAGLKSLAFPIRNFQLYKNAVDAKPIVRVAACMELAGLGIGNDSALINWTPLVDLPALCLLGPTRPELFSHAPLVRCLYSRTPLPWHAEGGKSGDDCSGCCYHFKHNPFCSQVCMSLANLLPAEVAAAAIAYHREKWG